MHGPFPPRHTGIVPAAAAASSGAAAGPIRLFEGLLVIAAAIVTLALGGCVQEPQARATVLRELDTGNTSSNGGGQRYLSNQLNETLTTRVR
jgi:hypothetical protein